MYSTAKSNMSAVFVCCEISKTNILDQNQSRENKSNDSKSVKGNFYLIHVWDKLLQFPHSFTDASSSYLRFKLLVSFFSFQVQLHGFNQ